MVCLKWMNAVVKVLRWLVFGGVDDRDRVVGVVYEGA
jgi:hypothetical protein